MVFLFLAASIVYNLLNRFKIHQRFSAKEVYFQVFPVSGLFQQEINCLLSSFYRHQLSACTVISCWSKAVLTAQITVHGNQQTHGLYRRSDRIIGILFIVIFGKQNLFPISFQDFCIATQNLFFVIKAGQLFHNFRGTFLCQRRCNIVQHIVGQLVHKMHAAAEHIQHDIIASQFIFMYHDFHLSFSDGIHRGHF